jgi:anti-sigma regulatory factor (Ser/Thr protein kinase)
VEHREVRKMERNGEVVRLRLPAEPFSRQLIRLTVYLIASRMRFDLSRLEDLRLAVDEASNYAIAHAPRDSSLEVEIDPGKEYLEIVLKSELAANGETRSAIPESFSRMIMESVVDQVDLRREEAACRISLRKKLPG